METFVEDPYRQNSYAARKAEERKLNSLKNINLPWVFVEPTRIKSVKIPKPKRTQNNFEELDQHGLEFLGNSKIPFSHEDISILQRSLNSSNESKPVQNNEFFNAFESIKKRHEENLLKRQTSTHVEQIPETETLETMRTRRIMNEVEEEKISTPRSREDVFDDLFESDDDNQKTKNQEEEEQMEAEAETVKSIIMGAMQDRAEAEKRKKKQTETSHPVSLFDFEVQQTTPNNHILVKERVTQGRRKLLSAIANSSSLRNEESSLAYAKKKMRKEAVATKSSLQKCFGAKHFLDYLNKQNVEVPKIMTELDFSEVKDEPQTTFYYSRRFFDPK